MISALIQPALHQIYLPILHQCWRVSNPRHFDKARLRMPILHRLRNFLRQNIRISPAQYERRAGDLGPERRQVAILDLGEIARFLLIWIKNTRIMAEFPSAGIRLYKTMAEQMVPV